MEKIKEYIYFDSIEISSILSQLDDGLVTVQRKLLQALQGTEERSEEGRETDLEGGVNAVAKAVAQHKSKSIHGTVNQDQTINSSSIESVYNDYAVNVIIKRLQSLQKIYNTTDCPNGSIIKITADYSMFEFTDAAGLFKSSFVNKMMGMDDEDGQSAKAILDLLDNTTADSALIKLQRALVIAKNNNFRMNLAQRQMLHFRKDKITVLGMIQAKITAADFDMNSFNDFENHPEFIGDVATRLSMFLWSYLKIIKKGDRLIKPIAIYFE
ncbi:DUF6414 family protein [Lactiplantibacillus plantarum]|uniref:DUF6414 family protein n=1 Tax=Lactiplantibacillus plantarum TaxID=1590 RepID=UPI001BAE26A0|nr:hypothetical protein [Lactiplantibacillus plantarum]MBS0955903.1 hypothetical protein [Lactiplantibacillus plantarum]